MSVTVQAGHGSNIVIHSVVGDLSEMFPNRPGIATSLTIVAAGCAIPPVIRASAVLVEAIRKREHIEAHQRTDGSKTFVRTFFQELSTGDFKFGIAALVAVVYFMNRNL